MFLKIERKFCLRGIRSQAHPRLHFAERAACIIVWASASYAAGSACCGLRPTEIGGRLAAFLILDGVLGQASFGVDPPS